MIDEAYKEARKFVNLERELGLEKNSMVIIESTEEKEKNIISPDKSNQEKIINKNKCFTPNHRVSSQWPGNKRS